MLVKKIVDNPERTFSRQTALLKGGDLLVVIEKYIIMN